MNAHAYGVWVFGIRCSVFRVRSVAQLGLFALAIASLTGCGNHHRGSEPLTVAVMDPLAAELACACVGGYARRDYHALQSYLSNRLEQPVTLVFADTLDKAVRQLGNRPPHVLIGKESVVQFDARQAALPVHPLCRLTGLDGRTTQRGLFVVRSTDSAHALGDLAGRRFLFGPPDSDEKHAAAVAALEASGVPVAAPLETRGACSDGAVEAAESTNPRGPVAVISGYALPLLEGCGNIEPGDLRVVGRTLPVPFITVFVADSLPPSTRAALRAALLSMKEDAGLLRAMESRDGAVGWIDQDWVDWRGPNRDGHVDWLPETLPDDPIVLWKHLLSAPGLGGPAVTGEVVLVPERDPFDERDIYRCLRASDGQELWTFEYTSRGTLDYGNSPRATPVIVAERAYLLGAHGELHCVRLADGSVLWKRHLVHDLGGTLPAWGYCSTPLVVGDTLVVNPGGPSASLVGLDRHSGEVRWTAPGGEPAYASFIHGEFGGRAQIIGYDATSLGGWDPRTGKRLWTLLPPVTGDFNVPTPLLHHGKLVVTTENNGARLYEFDARGRIRPEPSAMNPDLAPETVTPVLVGDRLFGCGSELQCLEVNNGLRTRWNAGELELGPHAMLIASVNRLLVTSHSGELFLFDISQPDPRLDSRLRVFDTDAEIYAHPALSHGRLILRNDSTLVCLALE